MGRHAGPVNDTPVDENTSVSGKRRALLIVLLASSVLAAVVFVVVANLSSFSSTDEPPSAEPTDIPPPVLPLGIAGVTYPTPAPTLPPVVEPEYQPVEWTRPTADPQTIAQALDVPVGNGQRQAVVQRGLDPLTIIPSRQRSSVITYRVRSGDNLRSIADRFGISENTIIWSNDRFYVNAMQVGLELNILPVNGAYHQTEEPQSIQAIADQYEVSPYDIIDSEFNNLFNSTPQTIVPAGLWLVIPGGTGSTEPIYWDPGIVIANTNSNTNSGAVGAGVATGATAAFAVGDPGSCGYQQVSNGSAPVSAPIYANYRITQNYSWNHGGIDLAVPNGTPVFAAGGGTVIFNGLSTWGYGWTVVIAHGSTLSIYGHLNGDFVECGEVVSAGQNIAVSGNSGRSSGPHLHFEIRGAAGVPVDPWSYQSF